MQYRRVVFVLLLIGASAACGLGALGTMEPAAADDGGAETGANLPPDTGASADSQGAGDSGFDLSDAGDASVVDYVALCKQACPDAGGSCDGGTCVRDCSGSNDCKTEVVRCPPGVPCAVTCGGGACTMGVDCASAASCNIDCVGTNSCTNGAVTCGGATCNVTCQNGGTCTGGVSCDAGSCTLDCQGTNSCTGGVSCDAKNCKIQCVNGGSCTGAVSCRATGSCRVDCVGTNTCTGALTVTGDTADVSCVNGGSCSSGMSVTAGDGGVACIGNGTCGSFVYFDGGRGAFQCPDSCNYCCADASVCTGTANAQAACP